MAQYKEVIRIQPIPQLVYSAPEVRKQCAEKDLMFNVGFHKENEED
jgi:hypothetical protein